VSCKETELQEKNLEVAGRQHSRAGGVFLGGDKIHRSKRIFIFEKYSIFKITMDAAGVDDQGNVC
jgi:hypothetical protein